MSRGKFSYGEATTSAELLYRKNQENYGCAGGFMDDDDEEEQRRERISDARQKRAAATASELEAPDNCSLCSKPLIESFLWDHFNCPVCNVCRDSEGCHKLIARTEAKKLYLLKDCDFDLRKPVLRYISKKNPHNPRYGDMKLYLKCQLESRCLEIYESWEKFETLKKTRQSNKERIAEKRFEKKIKEMRKQVRGAGIHKVERSKLHVHEFGTENFDPKSGEYWKICSVCNYKMAYEKL